MALVFGESAQYSFSINRAGLAMISDDELIAALQEARGDSNVAFVKVERKLRDALNRKLKEIEDNQSYEAWNSYYIEYMNHTLAAAKAFDLHAFDGWKVPSHSHSSSLSELVFGLFRRHERVHFPFGSRYGSEFLYCLGSAGT